MAYEKKDDTAFEDFKAAIKAKRPGRFYVFCGQEAFLREHWLGRLHTLLIEPFAEEFNYHRFSSETFSAQALSESIDALPMMAEHSMVQLDDIDLFKLPEDERTSVAVILSDLPDYCTVVLVYDTVEFKPDKRMKTLWQAVSKAEVVEFRSPGERELATWIARYFKSFGKTVSYPTCQYLISVTGGDMTTLRSEIGKLAAYAQGEEITREDVDAVVEPVLEAVVFDLSDAVAAGRGEDAVRTLGNLLQMQEEPIPILGAISGQMRRILAAKTLSAAGKGTQELMSLFGIKLYPAQKTFGFARRLSDRFCERAVALCLDADERMKTSYDDPERLLELLVLTLAQEARHG